jgi:hypothetical protein
MERNTASIDITEAATYHSRDGTVEPGRPFFVMNHHSPTRVCSTTGWKDPMTDPGSPFRSLMQRPPDSDRDTKKSPFGIPQRPKGPANGGPTPKKPRIPPWLIGLLFLGLLAYQIYAIFDPQRDTAYITIPYSLVEKQITDGNVESVVITGTQIEASLKQPIGWDRGADKIVPAPTEATREVAVGERSGPVCRRSRTRICSPCWPPTTSRSSAIRETVRCSPPSSSPCFPSC